MNYVQGLLLSKMFPDFYQPAPVPGADESVLSAESQPGPTRMPASFAEVLNYADEFYQSIAERTSTRSFPRLTGSGLMVRGAYWMLDISEYPNADDGFSESSLAEILEFLEDWLARHPGMSCSDWENYIRSFYLSQTACAGILRRAEARGKAINEPLLSALKAIAESKTA